MTLRMILKNEIVIKMMGTKESTGYKKELFLTIIALAWPTLLEQMLQTLVQYIDALRSS